MADFERVLVLRRSSMSSGNLWQFASFLPLARAYILQVSNLWFARGSGEAGFLGGLFELER